MRYIAHAFMEDSERR